MAPMPRSPLRAILTFLLVLLPVLCLAAPVTVSWAPNPPEDGVVGYILCYGSTSRIDGGFTVYDSEIDVGNVTGYTVDLADPNAVWYFAVISYDAAGFRSDYSPEYAWSGAANATHVLVASVGLGGSLAPAGTTSVLEGASLTYAVAADAGYEIADVVVDGVSVGAVSAYTFSNVIAGHTISATFSEVVGVPTSHELVASAGTGGTIAPAGTTLVTEGASLSYTLTPDAGYEIADLVVDGSSVGGVGAYTFSNVTAGHTIVATFTAIVVPPATHELVAGAGVGGSISPGGSSTVTEGDSLTYTIAAEAGYAIADVVVDGVSVGAVDTYTFSAVVAGHTISATFGWVATGDTVTVSFGGGAGADYPGTVEDTFINLNADTNGGSLALNTYTWPENSPANAIILKWDLSALPAGAVIHDAQLQLYMTGYDGDGGDAAYAVTAHKIINHDPVVDLCDGFSYDGTNGWTPSAAAYNSIPLAQGDIETAAASTVLDKTPGYKTWNVTSVVRDWVATPAGNFGLLLNSDDTAVSSSNRVFASSEVADAGQRPVLTVVYSVDGGVPTAPTRPLSLRIVSVAGGAQ